jgi:hypothetical protein
MVEGKFGKAIRIAGSAADIEETEPIAANHISEVANNFTHTADHRDALRLLPACRLKKNTKCRSRAPKPRADFRRRAPRLSRQADCQADARATARR